jgi:lipid A 4'-phosphatase
MHSVNIHKKRPSRSWCDSGYIGVGLLVATVIVMVYPAIDLWCSRWFYRPLDGFWINGLWWERILYHSINWVVVSTILGLMIGWLGGRWHFWVIKPLSGRTVALLLILLALVPGLFVNEGLKAHWGRARPVDITLFGGQDTFTPAWQPSDHEGGSFSSGHVAAAAYVWIVALIVEQRRRLWRRLAVSYLFVIAFIRIASGGHFVSDVLVSCVVVWFSYWLLKLYLQKSVYLESQ